MLKSVLRNLVVAYGVYQVSWWVANPLAFAYAKLTQRIIYTGDFAGAVLMPLVLTVPYALVAVGAGACVAWLVESERPFRWSTFAAALYAYSGFFLYSWEHQPTALDRAAQIVDATFLGIACVIGGMLFVRLGR